MNEKNEDVKIVVSEKSMADTSVPLESDTETAESDEDQSASAAEQDDGASEQENEAQKRSKREERAARRERQRRARDAQEHKLLQANERIAFLENKLNQVEKRQNHLDDGRIEQEIREQEKFIETIKHHMTTTEDRKQLVDLTECFHDAKDELKRLKMRAEKPKEAPPRKKLDRQTENYAQDWMRRNSWYDPEGQGADSKMVLAIDQQLMDEGWDAKTQDYWDELQERVEEVLPHRFRQVRRSAPVTSNRATTSQASGKAPKGYIHISPERKEALMQAGVWDDPILRQRYARRYQKFDEEEALKGN